MHLLSRSFEIIHEVLSQTDNRLIVTALCKIAGVSRSGYYNWVRSADIRAKREARDRADFQLIPAAYTFRGYDKGARKVLLTDITYIPYNGAFIYLSTVPDAYTRQILSHVLSESLEHER